MRFLSFVILSLVGVLAVYAWSTDMAVGKNMLDFIKNPQNEGKYGFTLLPESEYLGGNSQNSKPNYAKYLGSGCGVTVYVPESVMQWCDLITQYSNAAGIEPNLTAIVIKEESMGNERVISHSGAVGLMQIMARDGLSAQLYGSMFADRPSVQELSDPEFNIQFGTSMLADLIRRRGLRDGIKSYGPSDAGYTYADNIISQLGK